MTICEKYKNITPKEDFDWSMFEDGWNGVSLTVNSSVKTNKDTKVFCHETYVSNAFKMYSGETYDSNDSKDLVEGGILRIKDMRLISKDELLLSTSTGGSAVVKLSRENKFFAMFSMTKDEFKQNVILNPNQKQVFLNSGYLAKVGRNGVASLYDGVLIKTEQEFHEQIALGKKANTAYTGKIIGSNRGGYIMDVCGVKCFLPGSHAASNKVNDFESLVGTEMEVMILKYIEGSGFLVSRKKYLATVLHEAVANLRKEWKKNPEQEFTGTVTGAKHFGIFVELNEHYTGLLHKTYMSEEWLSKIAPTDETDLDGNARRNVVPGTKFTVKIYDITDEDRIVFTDILDKNERERIVKERERIEAEKEAAAKKQADEERMKKVMSVQDKTFKNRTVSLEDLRK